jgi:Vitamin K-dependent gamma-carboxylase
LFGTRLLVALLLVAGTGNIVAEGVLLLTSAVILKRCDGPYNGGSDRLAVLMLFCLLLANTLPVLRWRELAFGYLALQLLLSYAMAGWVKIVNPDWRRGIALNDVFAFSAYPVSEQLRGLAARPRLLFYASWGVMLFELLFPLSLFDARLLYAALVIAALFHIANALLFGLNRFVWVWIAAYPSLLWLQGRIV